MRSLVLFTILCVTSTSAFACVFDSDCERGTMCLDGLCTRYLSGNTQEDVPVKPPGKTCDYDGDCAPGSRCIKGSAPWGICLGR
jgi:Dickkopf N-terminal cysteine-rich region